MEVCDPSFVSLHRKAVCNTIDTAEVSLLTTLIDS